MHGLADARCVAGSRRKGDRRRVQDTTLKRKRDVDAVVKGNHSKGSGSKGTDLCKKCEKKCHCARDRRGPREGAEKGTKGEDGKKTGKGKGVLKKFDGNCGKYDHRTETCWTTCSTKPTEKGQGSARKLSKRMLLTSTRKQMRTPRKTSDNSQTLCVR